MSDFMQRQITGNQNWLRVETTCGTEFVPSGELGLFVRNSEQAILPLSDTDRARYEKQIRPYTEGTIESWENIKGYGARLSAPGYLDCTEWAVFDTEDEARAYLDEYYPEDEETGDPCPC
jgi:hypothetical protein